MTRGIRILALLNLLLIVLSSQAFGQTTLTKEILWTADWSPNGKYIAIGGNVDALKIYREKNLELYESFPLNNTITRVK